LPKSQLYKNLQNYWDFYLGNLVSFAKNMAQDEMFYIFVLKIESTMIVERTANEFVIRVPFSSNVEQMQDLIDYLRYRELTMNYSVEQSDIDALAQSINRNWWQQNQSKFEK
jgi:hypothetical protein